uniref:Uncharacterized protein n=1 Tax=Cajanus cajan TaxID=3821 RepID=A0A151SZU7_CAJCA|nr:hypothetical protein KK1_015788 [Cajanus cajan]
MDLHALDIKHCCFTQVCMEIDMNSSMVGKKGKEGYLMMKNYFEKAYDKVY